MLRTPTLVLFILCAVLATLTSQAQDAPQEAQAPSLSARQMLERFGVDASQQAAFVNGESLTHSEEDVLAKVLYHLPRLGRDNLHRWRQSQLPPAELQLAPEAHRFEVYRLAGRAKRVTKRSLLSEQAELYEFGHYYHVTVALADSPHEAMIAARRVPEAWPLDEPLDEPAAADALFVKLGNKAAQPQALVFAAERVAWFPDAPNASRGVGPADVALAKAGFDIGLWDQVRNSQEHAINVADREPFYQLLSTLPQARPALPEANELSVAKLLAAPAEHQGNFYTVQGLARRVLRVPVGDSDVQARFGIDHYYEIDLFLPLGETSLRLGKPGKSGDAPVFENEFPATLIVGRLPPGLEVGENVHQLVAADAVFFKVWAYRSSYAGKFGQLQPAPLFLAAVPRVVTIETPQNWLTGGLVLVALGLVLAVAAAILWSQARGAKRARRHGAEQNVDFRF